MLRTVLLAAVTFLAVTCKARMTQSGLSEFNTEYPTFSITDLRDAINRAEVKTLEGIL